MSIPLTTNQEHLWLFFNESGLCPPPDPTDEMTKSSSVEELPDPIPDLFNVLTEEVDHQERWTTFTYAVDLDKLAFIPGAEARDKGVKIITVGEYHIMSLS